jgi:hypothetical protein
VKDIEGDECSLVMEHVFDPLYALDKQKETDLAYFYIDDPELLSRYGVRVDKGSGEDQVIRFSSGDTFDVTSLQKLVCRAILTGETEIDLSIGGEKEYGAWVWGAWALIDLSCSRVYAFKVLLQQGPLATTKTMACLGYVLCPEYGDVIDEHRAIQYAVEKVGFPTLESVAIEDVAQDDLVDDPVSESAQPGLPVPSDAHAAPSAASHSIASEERLASMDASLARIATAVELLADHLIRTHSSRS